jgi:hypothetical protein
MFCDGICREGNKKNLTELLLIYRPHSISSRPANTSLIRQTYLKYTASTSGFEGDARQKIQPT